MRYVLAVILILIALCLFMIVLTGCASRQDCTMAGMTANELERAIVEGCTGH